MTVVCRYMSFFIVVFLYFLLLGSFDISTPLSSSTERLFFHKMSIKDLQG